MSRFVYGNIIYFFIVAFVAWVINVSSLRANLLTSDVQRKTTEVLFELRSSETFLCVRGALIPVNLKFYD